MLSAAFLASLFFLSSAAAQTTQAPATTRYFIVFLRPDPARKHLPDNELERIQAAHMANIQKMAADGVMVSAGPFDDTPSTISGIFIFKVDSLDRAKSIAQQDPTVLEHRNTVDVHPWDGPAGIGDEYFRLHRLDPKTPENMQIHPFCILLPGASWQTHPDRKTLLGAHERYIVDLRKQGILSAAGPVAPPDELLGFVVFRPIPLEKAQQSLADDPAVKAGLLRAEFHNWWSSDHVLPW